MQHSGRRWGAGVEGIAPAARGDVAEDLIHDRRVGETMVISTPLTWLAVAGGVV